LINLFFKFLSPVLFEVTLDRAAEMMVGVLVPLLILGIFELTLPTSETRIESTEKQPPPRI